MDVFDTFMSVVTEFIGARWRTILICALLAAAALAGYYHAEIGAFVRTSI